MTQMLDPDAPKIQQQHYGERASRVLYYAFYEAQQDNAHHISPIHILKGLLREDKNLMRAFCEGVAAEARTQDFHRAELKLKADYGRKREYTEEEVTTAVLGNLIQVIKGSSS
jgi:ATP-dependent Clp protease ATP-binding subunit ClpA